MGYKVIRDFADSSDNDYLYKVGDVYPRIGNTPDDETINRLSTTENPHKLIFIEKVKDNDNSRTSRTGTRRP